jgi:hypothetical protein
MIRGGKVENMKRIRGGGGVEEEEKMGRLYWGRSCSGVRETSCACWRG